MSHTSHIKKPVIELLSLRSRPSRLLVKIQLQVNSPIDGAMIE
jgi:hypothetical protein